MPARSTCRHGARTSKTLSMPCSPGTSLRYPPGPQHRENVTVQRLERAWSKTAPCAAPQADVAIVHHEGADIAITTPDDYPAGVLAHALPVDSLLRS